MLSDEDQRRPDGGIGPLVLVVDDEEATRSAVGRMIRGLGYRVQACQGGNEALRYLQSHPREVKLLLADVDMPRMDGGELVERAKDLDPGLRAALMVGRGGAAMEELLAGYEDVPRLSKPIGFAELYGRLRELLGPPAISPARASGSQARPRSSRRPSGKHEL
jgi:CheY-like chemotaxis protein